MSSNIPDLEDRFLAPPGWQQGSFINPSNNHDIHYGFAAPDNPKAAIIILPGLSEFEQQYFETARDMLSRGFAVWTINWHYQGRSGRFPTNPHKRHSDGFESDIDDVVHLITDHIKPNTDLPFVMLAHSTGGNIGLRILADHPDLFQAAAFSAPLIGIKGLTAFPDCVLLGLTTLMIPFHHAYVPGGKDWDEAERKSDGTDKFSSDPVRDQVHNAWCLADPNLQTGNPTWGWLHHALKSMAHLKRDDVLSQINTPCLFGLAGRDEIVETNDARKIAKKIKTAQILELENAKHEILMERNEHRDRFLHAFDALLADHDIIV